MKEGSHKPLLLLLKGHPGTGKSTLATCLAKSLACALIDKDDIRDALAACIASEVPAETLNSLSYDAMWKVAGRQLACSNSVIVDCPLARRQLYDTGCGLAAQHGSVIVVIEVVTADAVAWRRRLEDRCTAQVGAGGPQHKPATWEQLQILIAGYRGCHSWPADVQPEHFLLLDTSVDSVAILHARTLDYLAVEGLIA